ncbi:HEAT repeat-containing protein 6 [Homalodisca vitripennis]|nr:HEAT repeat-containing protein 6 [Homalodisca vitripennis]
MADEIVATLCVQLEAKASLTTPQDVRVWRVQCLKAIAPAVKPSCRPKFISSLWQLLQQSPSMNCDADAQVVKFVLEALETICESDVEWLTENLGDVLGVVVAFLQFGLHGWQYQKPSKLLPLPGVQWDPPPAPNIKSKAKRRQKKRVSNIGAMEVEDGADERTAGIAVTKPGYMSAPASGAWLTSDSEVSDSEGGRTRRLRRAQAKVRLSAINLLVQVAKAVNIRELFGYYSSLVGSQGLSYNLVNDTNARLTSVAASTTAFLLGNAKSYFAQALQSSVTSYTPFSSVLASLLDNLHQCMVRSLKTTGSMSVLHCACSLVDVTPYHRMKPGLLTPLVHAALPQLRHKEMVVSVAALTLLGCVVAVDPQTEELKQILSVSRIDSLPDVPETPGCSWVLSAALQYLETENQKAVSVPLRVEWWQLLANMSRHHFSLVRPHIMPLVAAVLRDMTGTNTLELARLHATRTFQQLATALAASDEALCTQVWQKAFESQLLGLVGISPTLASVVCDCLVVMSPATYHQLTEKFQISCMTSLLCCARDDEPVVRAAALQAMASLLIYSQVTVLYMLTNCCKICLSCMTSLPCCARDDEPVVRAAALQAMASLLIYSQLHDFTACCARDDEPVVRTAALQARCPYSFTPRATVIRSLFSLNPEAELESPTENVFYGKRLKFSPVSSMLQTDLGQASLVVSSFPV